MSIKWMKKRANAAIIDGKNGGNKRCILCRSPQPPSVSALAWPAIVFEPAVIICKLALKLKMATTLDEMAALFATKTSNLKRSMELRSAGKAINRNCKLYI